MLLVDVHELARPDDIVFGLGVLVGQLGGVKVAEFGAALLAQAVVGGLDRGKISRMAVDHDAHTKTGQTRIVAQRRVAVTHQHQGHPQMSGNLLQMVEVTHADQADGIGTGFVDDIDQAFGNERTSDGNRCD